MTDDQPCDRTDPTEARDHDEAVLRMLAGANFGPGASIILPSGRKMGGDEAQALTSFYVDEDRAQVALLWRFDVPSVPAHVTAFKYESDRVWLRLPGDQWALADWDPEYIRWCENHAAEGHKTGYPLVDVLDSAPLVECEDPRGAA